MTASSDEGWKAFGRDNPAGKILHNIYDSGASMRTAGNKYSKKNIQRELEKRASGVVPTRPLPCEESRRRETTKKKVPVPFVYGQGGGTSEDPLEAVPKYGRVDFLQKKKNLAEIEREGGGLFAERERYRPTFRAGQLRGGEEEKERLAKLHEFNGKLPTGPSAAEVRDQERATRRERDATKSKREIREELMDAILEEIKEREDFLEAVKGRNAEYEAAMKAEIAERLRELKKLEEMDL